MIKKTLSTTKGLDGLVSQKREIAKIAAKNLRFGFDDDVRTFLKKMFLLAPAAYGRRMENYMIEKAGLIRVSPSEDRGDSRNDLGAYFEGKISFKDTRGSYSLIQMRPWQDLSGYYFVLVDPDNDFEEMYFYLTKTEGIWEAYHAGHTIHGTKKVVAGNKYNSRKIELKEGSLAYERWLNEYRVPDFDTLNKILNKKPFDDEKRVLYAKKYFKKLHKKVKKVKKHS